MAKPCQGWAVWAEAFSGDRELLGLGVGVVCTPGHCPAVGGSAGPGPKGQVRMEVRSGGPEWRAALHGEGRDRRGERPLPLIYT